MSYRDRPETRDKTASPPVRWWDHMRYWVRLLIRQAPDIAARSGGTCVCLALAACPIWSWYIFANAITPAVLPGPVVVLTVLTHIVTAVEVMVIFCCGCHYSVKAVKHTAWSIFLWAKNEDRLER